MTAMSAYLETAILGHQFLNSTYAKPAIIGIALCTASMASTMTGATIPEVANSGSYARQALNPSSSNWAAISNGTTSNTPAITFSAATADWGTVVGCAILDGTTVGGNNLLYFGTLGAPKVVSNGDTFQFSAGSLSINLS